MSFFESFRKQGLTALSQTLDVVGNLVAPLPDDEEQYIIDELNNDNGLSNNIPIDTIDIPIYNNINENIIKNEIINNNSSDFTEIDLDDQDETISNDLITNSNGASTSTHEIIEIPLDKPIVKPVVNYIPIQAVNGNELEREVQSKYKTRLENKVYDYEQITRSYEDKNNDLTNELLKLKSQPNQLDLKSNDDSINGFHEISYHINQSNALKDNEISILNNKISELHGIIDKLTNDNEILTSNTNISNHNIQSLKDIIVDNENSNQILQKQLNDYINLYNESINKQTINENLINQLTNQLEKCNENQDSIINDLDKSKFIERNLLDKVNSLQLEIDSLRQNQSESITTSYSNHKIDNELEIIQLQSQIKLLENQIQTQSIDTSINKYITDLNDKIVFIYNEVKEFIDIPDGLVLTTNILDNKSFNAIVINNSIKLISLLSDNVKILNKELTNQQNYNQLISENERLVQVNNQLNKKLDSLLVQINNNNQVNSNTNSEQSNMKQMIQKYETENKQLQIVISQLRNARKSNKEDIEQVIIERDQLKSTNNNLNNDVQRLSNELTNQIVLQDKINELSNQLDRNIRTINELTNSLIDEKTKTNEQFNIINKLDNDMKLLVIDKNIIFNDLSNCIQEKNNLLNIINTYINEKNDLKKEIEKIKEKNEIEKQVDIEKYKDIYEKKYQVDIQIYKQQINELENKLTNEILYKRKLEYDFNIEKNRINKILVDTLEQLKNSQLDVVDRTLISNLIISYFKRKRSIEVLDLISRVLNFNEDQKITVGLKPAPVNIISNIFKTIIGSNPEPVQVDGDNLAELWVNYLLTESETIKSNNNNDNPSSPKTPTNATKSLIKPTELHRDISKDSMETVSLRSSPIDETIIVNPKFKTINHK